MPGAGPKSVLARPGSRVLVAGTATHPAARSQLPDVPAVAASVTDLAAALRDQAGIPDENLTSLVDPADPLVLGQLLGRVAAEATDALMVYYIGHGLVGDDRELYLATSATDSLVRGLDFTALRYRAMLRSLGDIRARTVVIVLDCCFSGRAELPSGQPSAGVIFEQSPVHGGFLLTSSARDELALAGAGETHTRFTGALIRLLRDGDPDGPHQLTLDHVYRYLNRELREDGVPRPHRRSSDGAGELVLAPNRGYRDHPAEWLPGDDSATVDGTPDGADEPCPYRGLQPFSSDDARFFFGREDIVQELIQRIEAIGGLIPLIGPSGCGKTSLLRAGMVPRLLERGWDVSVLTPGSDPVVGLNQRAEALSARDHAVLIVDQFEELFTAGISEDGRHRFLSRLTALPVVIISVRADFYGQCLRYPALVQALQSGQVLVEPMSGGVLRTVITAPAAAAGLRMEQGLADTLLNEAGLRQSRNQSAMLPLLSHALRETWQRRRGNLLTLAGYRETGGIEEAITQTAEKIYGRMGDDDQLRMRDLLLRMVHLGQDSEDTRRQLPVAGLSEPDRLVLDALARARLVTLDEERAEIAHDAMLYAWPRLGDWIEQNRAALIVARQLDDAAEAWRREGRREEYLYRGSRLTAAVDTVQRATGIVRPGPAAQEFLDASQEHQLAEQHAERRRGQRRRAVLAVIGVLVLAAGAVGFISVRESSTAAQHAAVIRSENLAADAASLRATDPGLAAQLSVAAYRSSPTEDAATQLYASASQPVDSFVGSFGDQVTHVTAQTDGPLTAADDGGGHLRVWNIANPSAPILQGTIAVASKAPLALAPRKPLLAALCPAGDLCLWNVAKRGAPAPIAHTSEGISLPSTTVTSMAISPDGTLLALSSRNDGTLLFSIAHPADPRLLAVLPDHASNPSSLAGAAFSPRGDLLAETIDSGTTKLWSLSKPARPALVALIRTGYQAVAFNPGGTLLAAVGNASDSDSDVGLWNITRPAKPSGISIDSYTVDNYDLETVAFTPDGRYLAYGGAQTGQGSLGTLGLLDLSQANLAGGSAEPTIISTGFITPGMTAAVGDTLLTGSYDGVVRLWHMTQPETSDTGSTNNINWAISNNGHLMAAPVQLNTGTATGIWDISGQAPKLAATIPVDATSLSFLDNDRGLLAVEANSGSVDLWNVAHPSHPVHSAALGAIDTSGVGDLAPGGDVASDAAGRLVSVLGTDGRLHLWRITNQVRAIEVGRIPVPDGSADLGAVLGDGQHADIITPHGIQWWGISDPAHPVRIGFSALATATGGSGQASTSSLFAATTASQGSCDCSTLDIFDLVGRHVTASATVSRASGGQLQISASSRLLASTGSGDNGLTLWNIRDPRHPAILATLQTVQGIQGIAFSDNDMLLADWNSSELDLWNISKPGSPVQIASVTFQQQPQQGGNQATPTYASLNSAAFTPSGSRLAVPVNNSIVFLDTDPAAIATQICSAAGPAITRAQWSQYAPNTAYQDPCRAGS